MIPAAIILAGIIVAGALIFNSRSSNSSLKPASNLGALPTPEQVIQPVTADDHIVGKLGAKVTIVEYADLECPYCKAYEPVLNQIMSTYGTSSGEVAWVYRHFPIHSRGPYEAEAAECAADQGGNDTFFKFIDQIFTVTKADDNLDPKVLTQTAGQLGLNTTTFQNCLDSKKFEQKVLDARNDALAAGGQGTPYTVFITADGKKYPLTDASGNPLGAVSYNDLKSVVDQILKSAK